MSRDKCKSPALGHVWSPEQLRVVGAPGYFPALQKGVWSCSRSCKQVYNFAQEGFVPLCSALLGHQLEHYTQFWAMSFKKHGKKFRTIQRKPTRMISRRKHNLGGKLGKKVFESLNREKIEATGT